MIRLANLSDWDTTAVGRLITGERQKDLLHVHLASSPQPIPHMIFSLSVVTGLLASAAVSQAATVDVWYDVYGLWST